LGNANGLCSIPSPFQKLVLEPADLHSDCCADQTLCVFILVMRTSISGGGMTFQDLVIRASQGVLDSTSDDLKGKSVAVLC